MGDFHNKFLLSFTAGNFHKIQLLIKMAFKPFDNLQHSIPSFYLAQDIWRQPHFYTNCFSQQSSNSLILAPIFLITVNRDQDILARPQKYQNNFNQKIGDVPVQKPEILDTRQSSEQTIEQMKIGQNKTKDLMRPFARMLYSHFKKLLKNNQIQKQSQKLQILNFNTQVDQLRSRHPFKFTQVVINFLKTVSDGLKACIEEYIRGMQFFEQILGSDSFKHWKSKQELVEFFRQFTLNNKKFLKPTKFYKFQYRKNI